MLWGSPCSPGLPLPPVPPWQKQADAVEALLCCGLSGAWSSPGYTGGHMQCSQCQESGWSVQWQTLFCPTQYGGKMASVGFSAALFSKRALPLLLLPIWLEVSVQGTFRSSTSLKLKSFEIQKSHIITSITASKRGG